MSHDNIAIFLTECVSKDLAGFPGVILQFIQIAEGSDRFSSIPASSAPFDQVNNIDMCFPYSL